MRAMCLMGESSPSWSRIRHQWMETGLERPQGIAGVGGAVFHFHLV
jgi:hypothetical protein